MQGWSRAAWLTQDEGELGVDQPGDAEGRQAKRAPMQRLDYLPLPHAPIGQVVEDALVAVSNDPAVAWIDAPAAALWQYCERLVERRHVRMQVLEDARRAAEDMVAGEESSFLA